MKFLLFTIMLFLVKGDFNKIAEINRLKKEAQQAYHDRNFKEAVTKYSILVDSLGQNDDELLMNLAHCYFNLKDTTHAINHYKSLTKSDNKSFQSVAWQQLGILDAETRNFADAEEDFKNSLRANPANDDARYNYELLKKKLKNQEQKNKNDQNNQQKQNKDNQQKNNEQQNQQQNDQQQNQQQDQNKQEQQKNQADKDQQQKQEQSKQQQGQEDKKNDEKQNQQDAQQQNDQNKNDKEKSQSMSNEKFDENKISQEKARMILEAMKNTEEQYLQQLKRKPAKKSDSGKPDW
jgi:Ca-activated chloride channel homolog